LFSDFRQEPHVVRYGRRAAVEDAGTVRRGVPAFRTSMFVSVPVANLDRLHLQRGLARSEERIIPG